jgi:putative hemolysin
MNSMQVIPSHFATRFSITLAEDDDTRNKCLAFRQRIREVSHSQDCVRNLATLYDQHGVYLMVTDNATGEIVAMMKVLTSEQAITTNGFEAETCFDLSALLTDRTACMELDQPYILAGYEPGMILQMMYIALRGLVIHSRCEGFFTRISLPLYGGDRFVQTLVHSLSQSRFALPAELVKPRVRLRGTDAQLTNDIVLPAVLRSFLQLGARVCSEPYWDAELGTAEILLWFEVDCLRGLEDPDLDAVPAGHVHFASADSGSGEQQSGMNGY